MQLKYPLPNEAETARIAQKLSKLVQKGDVVALHGDLGAGKTTFSKALIRYLVGLPNLEVPSPTFTLVQTYESSRFPIWHFDMYRLDDPSEIDELGFEETIDGLAIIEWPEKMGETLPTYRIDIKISFENNKRTMTLTPQGKSWSDRLDVFDE